MSQPVEPHLNSEHRDTVAKILGHPTSANIEWRQVVSLLEAIATVTVGKNGELNRNRDGGRSAPHAQTGGLRGQLTDGVRSGRGERS